MHRYSLVCVFAALTLPGLVAAQYPSSEVNLTTVRSPINDNITISYKVPEGTCKTAFKSQKQYTGWVNVPGDYPTNLFFWFVEARQQSDLLTIWLNGGPGASSLFGMFGGVGPCDVVEKGLNEYETLVNEWGWDRASNMLFIDQPNQVGFSYDTPTNGSIDFLNNTEIRPPQPIPSGQAPYTFLNGTFSSNNITNTANTTDQAATAVWHLLQGFLAHFPEYSPPNTSSLGVNLFAESYGGKYGPVFMDVWARQNKMRQNNTRLLNSTLEIHLASLGIVNGCVDDAVQMPFYPAYAIGNTYGLQGLSSVRAQLANASLYAENGCLALISRCRTAQSVYDHENTGSVNIVNSQCAHAYNECFHDALEPFSESGRSFYDIGRRGPDSFPPSTYLEYLNVPEVQQAIGAVTNYTSISRVVQRAFLETGDYVRGPILPRIGTLLEAGVRVALLYGDRDYICNWMGGEAVAEAIAWQSPDLYGGRFRDTGYAPIIVNDSYIGGVVRQYGNLSFSRIYQAGHSVPAYQPETAFQVFARIVLGTAISTGDKVDLSNFASEGDDTAAHEDDLPDLPGSTCWVRDAAMTCNDQQKQRLKDGEGVIINGVLYDASSDWPLATRLSTSSSRSDNTQATEPVRSTSSSTSADLTGVYTATSTPDNGSGGPSKDGRGSFLALFTAIAVLVWSSYERL